MLTLTSAPTCAEIDAWINGCKVRAFPWIDGETIYVNVQYFRPGQSVEQSPAWDRSARFVNDEPGRRFVFEFTHTMVEAFCSGKIPAGAVVKIG